MADWIKVDAAYYDCMDGIQSADGRIEICPVDEHDLVTVMVVNDIGRDVSVTVKLADLQEAIRKAAVKPEVVEEPIVMHVTFSVLQHNWRLACDVLGLDYYCMNEGKASMTDIVCLTEKQAIRLGFIRGE